MKFYGNVFSRIEEFFSSIHFIHNSQDISLKASNQNNQINFGTSQISGIPDKECSIVIAHQPANKSNNSLNSLFCSLTKNNLQLFSKKYDDLGHINTSNNLIYNLFFNIKTEINERLSHDDIIKNKIIKILKNQLDIFISQDIGLSITEIAQSVFTNYNSQLNSNIQNNKQSIINVLSPTAINSKPSELIFKGKNYVDKNLHKFAQNINFSNNIAQITDQTETLNILQLSLNTQAQKPEPILPFSNFLLINVPKIDNLKIFVCEQKNSTLLIGAKDVHGVTSSKQLKQYNEKNELLSFINYENLGQVKGELIPETNYLKLYFYNM